MLSSNIKYKLTNRESMVQCIFNTGVFMFICTYCGEHADCYDHTIPIAYRHNTRSNNENRTYAVPCCTECNTVLGSAPFFTIRERADYILKKYLKRHKKIINHVEWCDEELEEMSSEFKRTIKATMKMKEVIKSRIMWLKGMASESNNMEWKDAQAEFSSRKDRIEGVTVRGIIGANRREMKPRVVLAKDLLEDDVYSKEMFQEAIRQHFRGVGYNVSRIWFSQFTYID